MRSLFTALCAVTLGCASTPSETVDGAQAQDRPEPKIVDAGPDTSARDVRPTDAALTLDEACADLAARACDRMNTCEPFVVKQAFGTPAACTGRMRIACLATTASGARVTTAVLSQCARALEVAACSDIVSGAALTACFPAGTRADALPCAVNTQCASGYCQLNGAGCGMCRPRLAASARCDPQEDGQCQRGLLCAGTCVAPGGPGAACTDGRPCQAHLRCAAGLCVVPSGAGAGCAGGECNDLIGLACIKAAGAPRGTCQPMKLAAAGERCGMIGATIAACAAGATCAPDTTGMSHCVAPATDGQPCGGCLYPSVCVDKVCRVPASLPCN